jgi:hypothetical protein
MSSDNEIPTEIQALIPRPHQVAAAGAPSSSSSLDELIRFSRTDGTITIGCRDGNFTEEETEAFRALAVAVNLPFNSPELRPRFFREVADACHRARKLTRVGAA